MLRNNLYTVDQIEHNDGNTIQARISLDADHAIFKGHFPVQPILPGVCLLEMVKDVLESGLGKSYSLIQADQIKYLSMVDPNVNKILIMKITFNKLDEYIGVDASATCHDGTMNFKLKGRYT